MGLFIAEEFERFFAGLQTVVPGKFAHTLDLDRCDCAARVVVRRVCRSLEKARQVEQPGRRVFLGQLACEARAALLGAHEDQRLMGYRTLNLLNVNGDATFARPLLYSEIAQRYLPAPKANYVRVVINGESVALSRTFQTSMPAGKYCNVTDGELNGNKTGCTGTTITVSGRQTIVNPDRSFQIQLIVPQGTREITVEAQDPQGNSSQYKVPLPRTRT